MRKSFVAYLLSVFVLIGCGENTKVDVNYNTNDGNKSNSLAATPQSIILNETTTKVITLSANANNLFYKIHTQPSHGTLTRIELNIFRYTANENFQGTDSFSFTVNDGSKFSDPATVTIIVNSSKPQPIICKPLLKTGQSIIYHNIDDGDLQTGATRSYTRDDANGIVTDNVTGLMWQDNESLNKQWVTQTNYDATNYSNTSGDTATTYCENLLLWH